MMSLALLLLCFQTADAAAAAPSRGVSAQRAKLMSLQVEHRGHSAPASSKTYFSHAQSIANSQMRDAAHHMLEAADHADHLLKQVEDPLQQYHEDLRKMMHIVDGDVAGVYKKLHGEYNDLKGMEDTRLKAFVMGENDAAYGDHERIENEAEAIPTHSIPAENIQENDLVLEQIKLQQLQQHEKERELQSEERHIDEAAANLRRHEEEQQVSMQHQRNLLKHELEAEKEHMHLEQLNFASSAKEHARAMSHSASMPKIVIADVDDADTIHKTPSAVHHTGKTAVTITPINTPQSAREEDVVVPNVEKADTISSKSLDSQDEGEKQSIEEKSFHGHERSTPLVINDNFEKEDTPSSQSSSDGEGEEE